MQLKCSQIYCILKKRRVETLQPCWTVSVGYSCLSRVVWWSGTESSQIPIPIPIIMRILGVLEVFTAVYGSNWHYSSSHGHEEQQKYRQKITQWGRRMGPGVSHDLLCYTRSPTLTSPELLTEGTIVDSVINGIYCNMRLYCPPADVKTLPSCIKTSMQSF